MLPRALPISLSEYRGLLNNLWSNIPPRLGLAVSGGVDSMALSHLTHRLLKEQRVREVYAFIIDHGARPESLSEATSVAEILKSYGFISQIIPLTWGANGTSKSGFETRARGARYRALAKACVQTNIDKLLLAHHADDQAETVMMRLISGSRLDGLGGMKSIARIPECWNVFQATRVIVGRPFLVIGKERLQATCESNSVQWFEDKTNHDVTYTRRNTVRQLLTSTPPRLPRALQRESLVALASRAEEQNSIIKEAALYLLRMHCHIVISERIGSVEFKFPEDPEVLWKHTNPAVTQRALTMIAEKVSPAPRVETRHMATAFEKVLNVENSDNVKMFTCAGLTWTYNGKQRWTLNREPFSLQKKSISEVTLGPGLSEWFLWDGRWWISVETPPGYQSIIRILRDIDMGNLRSRASEIPGMFRYKVDAVFKSELKGALRFTVPAIFWIKEIKGEAVEVIAALPTLGLKFQKVKYEIRYKDC